MIELRIRSIKKYKYIWGMSVKRRSIVLQLILILFIVSSVPAIFAITVNSIYMRKITEEAISKSVMDKLQANQEFCDERLSLYFYEALDFILGRQYVNLNGITSYQELISDYDSVRLALSMNENMKNFVDRNSMVHSVFFYIEDSDYVVATNGGIVKLTDFEDFEWLQDIADRKKSASGTWYARQATLRSEANDTVAMLSYVYCSNSLYTSSKVTVAINVFEDEIMQLISPADAEMGGGGYLVDGEGNILAHSDSRYLYKNITGDIADILKAENKGGIITEDTGIIVYRKSSLYNWIYVNTYSNDQIYQQSGQIYQLGIIMTLVVILIGVVFAVFLSLKISKPVRRLVSEMKEMNLKEEETGNELTFLSSALEQIREREKQMKNSLAMRGEAARRRSVHDLMQGEVLQEEQIRQLEEFFPYHHFIMCMLIVDDVNQFKENTTHEERKICRNFIYEHLKQIFPSEYCYEYIHYDAMSIGIVINIKNYDSNRVTKEISEAMMNLKKYYNDATGWGLTIGVSLVHNYLEGIKECAEEARRAAERRKIIGKGNVIFAQQYKSAKIQTYDFYNNEKRIMNLLELGELDKIEQELDVIIRDIKVLDNISEDNVMLVFHQMIGNILIYLNKHNFTANIVLQEKQGNLYSVLTELETLEEIKRYLQNIFKQIIAYQMSENQEEEDSDYSRLILKYIRQYYRDDIEFERMAEEIGISYSYARKLIKNSTGKSLNEYQNLIRVEEAKKLLEKGSMSMNDISEAVGYHNVQSLYRFFKKFEGVSPSTYREEIMNKEQNDE